MKKRLILFIFLSFFAVSLPSVSEAKLKFDISEMAATVTGWIQKQAKVAQNKVEAAVEKIKRKTVFEKDKQKLEVEQARKNDIADLVRTSMKAYEDEDNFDSSGTSEKFGNSISSSRSEELTVQVLDLSNQMKDRKQALSDENAAKIKNLQENYNILTAMEQSTGDEGTLTTIAQQKATLEAEMAKYKQIQKEIEEEGAALLNDSTYKSLQEQKTLLESDLEDSVQSSLESMFSEISEELFKKSEEQKTREYNEEIVKNFLKEDEPVTQQTTDRIMKYRREVLRQEIEHALYLGMKIQIDMPERAEQVEKLTKNMAVVQYESSAVLLAMETRIEQLKFLFDYVELKLADMRLKSAREMLNQSYKLQNYNKNPAVMNLDNYIFTEKDLTSDAGQTSFLDSVKPK